jgi:prepilin-type processing-associated H-X9-DG protein
MLVCETLPDATIHNAFYGGYMAARSNIPINTFPTAADVADYEASGALCASGGAWSSPSGRHGSINAFNESIDHRYSGIMSRHPGGAVVAMADGSGRFLAETTDVYILVALGSRNLGASGAEPTTLP